MQPAGWIVLIWNARRLESTPFLQAYEDLLATYGTDYAAVRDRHPDPGQVQAFIGTNQVSLRTVDHQQWFDYEGLEGRLLSSSYVPEAGHPNFEPMIKRLRSIFGECQADGQVSLDYDTQIYCGQLATG